MKILLAFPNLRWTKDDPNTVWIVHPYNLCLLAAVIEQEHDVSILDANVANMTREQYASEVARHKPDLVGISVMTDEYGFSGHEAARLVKQVDPSISTVLGGVYPTVNAEKVASDPNVDYVAVGEGEHTFPKLLRALEGREDFPDRGFAFRRNGKLVVLPRADLIQDLDAIPRPAYHRVDFMQYAMNDGRASIDSPPEFPYARMFTSRGCPIGCIFCEVESISGKKFRPRSPENVVNELQWLKETYGIRSVVFDDDNFYVNRKRAARIFELMISRNLDLKWNAIAVPVFYLTEELLELMRESGCNFIDLAIESGVERVLKQIIHKPVKLDFAKKIIKKAKSLGINVSCNFVIGFPGETWNEIRQTLRFAEEIDVDYVKIFIATPLPRTRLWNICEEGGYMEPGSLDWRHGRIRTDEFTPRDLAILRAYEWDRINFSSTAKREKIARLMKMSPEELDKIRRNTRLALDLH